jgi:hypothetical protein
MSGFIDRPGRRESGAQSKLDAPLPVDDAEHQFQVLGDPRFLRRCNSSATRADTERGRLERPYRSCACSPPAPGRSPRNPRGRRGLPPGPRGASSPASARTSARKDSMRGPLVRPAPLASLNRPRLCRRKGCPRPLNGPWEALRKTTTGTTLLLTKPYPYPERQILSDS